MSDSAQRVVGVLTCDSGGSMGVSSCLAFAALLVHHVRLYHEHSEGKASDDLVDEADS